MICAAASEQRNATYSPICNLGSELEVDWIECAPARELQKNVTAVSRRANDSRPLRRKVSPVLPWREFVSLPAE